MIYTNMQDIFVMVLFTGAFLTLEISHQVHFLPLLKREVWEGQNQKTHSQPITFPAGCR